MARQVVLDYQGAQSSFDISRLSRDRLYGRKKRLVVDEDGDTCQSGLLTEDGSTLLPPASTADLYLDDAFDVVERRQLRAIAADGEEIDTIPSTLGKPAVATEVGPERLLEHATPTVYRFDPAELDPALQAKLESGAILETRFNYRDSYADQACFVIHNDHGFFALVGAPTGFEFLRPEAPPPPPPQEEEELDDDLDFGMF